MYKVTVTVDRLFSHYACRVQLEEYFPGERTPHQLADKGPVYYDVPEQAEDEFAAILLALYRFSEQLLQGHTYAITKYQENEA